MSRLVRAVEDSYNNAILADSATFTTGDSLPPTVEIEAVITASIATDSDITFTFSEKIRLINDSAIDNSNVGSLITLKDIPMRERHRYSPFQQPLIQLKPLLQSIQPVTFQVNK
jgi:hypothetical protein